MKYKIKDMTPADTLGLYRLLTRSVFENPVFAIAVRDDFNNYFILRRKSNNPIYGEREMLSRLNEISQESRTLISTSVSKVINKNLLGKMMDWTATKDDIEHLFSDLKKYHRFQRRKRKTR